MMVIDTEFEIEDVVYLKTDINQYPRIITKICLSKSGVTYELSAGTISSWHFGFEFSSDKDMVIKSENC